jgi:hydrogenase maturation factor
MCVTRVGQILSVGGDGSAMVSDGHTTMTISLAPLTLTGICVTANDWVLLHSGLAVERLSDADARRLLHALTELDDGADP